MKQSYQLHSPTRSKSCTAADTITGSSETFSLGHMQSYSVHNPQNSTNKPVPLAWCWLRWEHANKQSMCAPLEHDVSAEDGIFLSFSAAVRHDEAQKNNTSPKLQRKPVPVRCLGSLNCVSDEACLPSTLGSHTSFHVTLLYMRESIWFCLVWVTAFSTEIILRTYYGLFLMHCDMS